MNHSCKDCSIQVEGKNLRCPTCKKLHIADYKKQYKKLNPDKVKVDRIKHYSKPENKIKKSI